MASSGDDEETTYLRKVVLDYCDCKLVATEKFDRASLHAIFPLLRYAIDAPTLPEDVGLIWSLASDMDGLRYPHFALNYLTKAQTERVRKAIAAEKQRRKTIEV